jgi:hypothetical protein
MAYKTIQTQTLTVAKTDSIKRGFVKHFVDFIAKRGHATVAELQAEFSGRQFSNKKVTNARVVRYAYWAVANGVLKVSAKVKAWLVANESGVQRVVVTVDVKVMVDIERDGITDMTFIAADSVGVNDPPNDTGVESITVSESIAVRKILMFPKCDAAPG